jgi:hypothetical protein
MGSHVFSGVPVVTPRSNHAKNLIVPGEVSCKKNRTIIVGRWLSFPGEKLQGRGKRLDLTWVPGLAWLIIRVSIGGGNAGSKLLRSSWRCTGYTARASPSLWLNIPQLTICFFIPAGSVVHPEIICKLGSGSGIYSGSDSGSGSGFESGSKLSSVSN